MMMSDKNSTSHSYNDMDLALPKTATKPIIAPKKRGRPGSQIANAFKNVPEQPVDFVEYCEQYDVKPTVLRQIKRHDSCPETGRVYVKQSKAGVMEIWRDKNQVSPWLIPKDE